MNELNVDIDLGFNLASPEAETTFWTDLFKLAESVYYDKKWNFIFLFYFESKNDRIY